MSKYFLYARKSTESEDRQVMSIEQQIAEVKEYAKKEGLIIVSEFTESMTAKKPGRIVFNDMLARLEKREADGILAWNPDRLARNSIDGGRIIYLVDTGIIKSLKFPTFRFDNNAYGKFILSIAFGQSKYYTDSLSENIKRGIRHKLRKGIWPQWAPLGYLNDHKTKTIVLDKEKAPLIKEGFELYATGNYSLNTLKNILFEKGLIGKKDKLLGVSNIQYFLKNPVYYGVIRYAGEIYEGSHPPIITKRIFDKVQTVLKQRHRATRKKKYNFPFRGFIQCGECGGMITAEIQKKRYIYYHCTKRKGKCSQPYNTTEENIYQQLSLGLSAIWLNDKTTNKILTDLEKYRTDESKTISSLSEKFEKTLTDISQRLDRLLEGYISGLIDPTEYQKKKAPLIEEKIEIKQKLDSLKNESNSWFELAKDIVLTCNSVEKIIKERNYANLVKICRKTGSNFVLRDNTLSFLFRKPFDSFAGRRPAYRLPIRFVPSKTRTIVSSKKNGRGSLKNEMTANGSREIFEGVFSKKQEQARWRRGRDLNSRGPLRTPTGLANPPLQPLGYLSALRCILAKIRKIKRELSQRFTKMPLTKRYTGCIFSWNFPAKTRAVKAATLFVRPPIT